MMTSSKDALILLEDLEEYADNHHFPEAEKLIAQARQALDSDFAGEFRPVHKTPKQAREHPFQSIETRH